MSGFNLALFRDVICVVDVIYVVDIIYVVGDTHFFKGL